MTRRYGLFLLFISICSWLYAQHRVSGVVVDSVGLPVDAAVYSFIDNHTGLTLQQGLTTEQGEYSAMVEGRVMLYVSCLGYEPFMGEPFEVSSDTTLSPIVLQSKNFTLDDIVVVGEKREPAVRVADGKVIFSPRQSGLAAGSSALELLKKTPGVFVDGENNISIGGKGYVSVVLNGKPTYMQKEELVALLRTIPASSVSSVEVIAEPSARYDAEGSGGIINICTDRKPSEGLFFSMNNGLSYWRNLRQNTELSFNYTQGKLSLQGNYNHTFGHYSMDYGMHRIQQGKDYYSPTADVDKRKTIAGNLSLEYRFNDRHLLGVRADVNTLFGPGQTRTVTEIRDVESNRLEQTLYAQNDYYRQRGNRYGGNLYYVATPGKGTSYTVDLNYAWFDGGSGNMQPNSYRTPAGDLVQENLYNSVNGRDIHIYSLAYDQQHPLWQGELRSGLKYSGVDADNDFRFYRVEGDASLLDDTRSNDFTYREQILAAYLLYNHRWGNWGFEAGVRGEYTFSDGILRAVSPSDGERNRKEYFDLFPSLRLDYRWNGGDVLSLSYASRIDRPAYQNLNPFEYLLDELSYWKGNPFLVPQKTHSLSLTYVRKKTSLMASYAYMQDYRAQITDTLSVDKVVMTPRNIGRQQRVSLSLYQAVNLFHWWAMNLNITGYYLNNDIAFDAYRAFNLDGFAGIVSLQNLIRLPWQLRLELNGAYYTKHLGASNEYVEPSGYVDIGLSRSFLDKSLTINLAVSDIFWTSRWDNSSSFSGFRLWNWGKGESRQVKLNVTYRFGRQRERSHQSHFDEIDRL